MGIPLFVSMTSQNSPYAWRMVLDLAGKQPATMNCECYVLVYVQYWSMYSTGVCTALVYVELVYV